jgi:chitodextrinase
VTAAAGTSITVAWNASTDNVAVTGYGLYNGTSTVGNTGSTSLTHTFSGLSCGTGYTLAVDAYDAAANRSGKATVTGSTTACAPPADTQPPTMPGNLHVTAATGTSITVAWNASTDNVAVTGYGAYRNGSLIGSATSPLTYTFSGLACGMGYTLAVDAYDAAGNHSQPASISASSAACPPPPPQADTQPPTVPGNFRATAATGTSITVAWNTSTDNVAVTGYGLYRNSTLTASVTSPTYTFTGLACGTGYTLSVDAYDAAGNRSQRAAITAATGACPPPADTQPPTMPGTFRATVATATSITVAWIASTDNVAVAGYGLYNGSSNVGTVGATALTYTFSGLSCGTGYTLAVDASDAAGNRSAKATLTASTSACQPPPPAPGGEPGPIAGQGYRQVWGDEFNDSVLDASKWWDHEFWLTPISGSVVESGGAVSIFNRRPYYEDISIQSGPQWGGDVARHAWMFGYFEARMRFTDARGSWPAFWLQSVAHASDPSGACPEPDLNFELDIMEYQGDEPNTFYGTEHRNTNGYCGQSNPGRGVITSPGKLAGAWHTYAVKWTATDLTWYVDGVQQGSPQALFDSGDQLMFIALTMQACGWDSTNDCSSTTPDNLVTEVDWVHVWQK